jgi:hypothetical protein
MFSPAVGVALLEVSARVTVTHAPTETSASAAGTAWVNVVVLLYVTAVWEVPSCTCIVVPSIAAICPVTAGRGRWESAAEAAAAGAAVGDAAGVPEPPLPPEHAETAATPMATMANSGP